MASPIRGMARPIKNVNKDFVASIHNRFDIEVVDSETGEIKQRAQATNVICTNYWSKLFSGDAFWGIHYGTGSGTPSTSDTSLFAYLGYVFGITAVSSTLDTANNVYTKQGKVTLGTTTANGSTLTEIGLASDSATSALITHAMFKDMNGNAVSIAKSETDVINIYITVFVHWTDLKGFVPTEFFFNCLVGAGSVASDALYREVIVSYADGTSRTISTGWSFAVSGSNKTLTMTMAHMHYDTDNAHGIKGIRFYDESHGHDQISTTLPALWYAGSDIKGEAIGTGNGSTKDFSTYFPYASAAKIYVNGVQDTSVTVDNTSSVTTDIHFTDAPASGAVITADYHTSVIAKDATHEFDFSIVFQFGERSA